MRGSRNQNRWRDGDRAVFVLGHRVFLQIRKVIIWRKRVKRSIAMLPVISWKQLGGPVCAIWQSSSYHRCLRHSLSTRHKSHRMKSIIRTRQTRHKAD
jgi:hypothetical protein